MKEIPVSTKIIVTERVGYIKVSTKLAKVEL